MLAAGCVCAFRGELLVCVCLGVSYYIIVCVCFRLLSIHTQMVEALIANGIL